MATSSLAEGIPHLPAFITEPGQSDVLFTVTIVVVITIILITGVIYFKIHALPEHLGHGYNNAQLQLVGVLSLLSLITHNNIFWIAALLLVTIKLPDFSTPLNTIARSLEQITNQKEEQPVSAKMADFTTPLNSIAKSLEQMSSLKATPPVKPTAKKATKKKAE
ncbi:MAG: hypothetical protein IME92_07320 [Proteobacteria bacterium]|nr:hypothetical protein [Pseudomonadota bacterium]